MEHPGPASHRNGYCVPHELAPGRYLLNLRADRTHSAQKAANHQRELMADR